MGFGIDRVARSTAALKKPGRKNPDSAAEVGERLKQLARRIAKGAVVEATAAKVTLKFAPYARPVRLIVTADADIKVKGDTSALGPGYHAHVIDALAPIWTELDYAWVDDAPAYAPGAHLAWLQGVLRDAGDAAIEINMPAERTFLVEGDAPVLTPLGPRTRAWRDAVLADAAHGADMFPWFARGPAPQPLARALLAMWHEIPWRAPIADEEDALFARVHDELEAAHRAAPDAIPWGAWRALHDLAPAEDLPAAVAAKIAAATADRTIGYRRHDLETDLPVGWTLRMPGAFTGGWVDDDTRYVATDGERSLELVTLTAANAMDSAALLAHSPAQYPVAHHEATGTRAARLESEPDGTMHGIVCDAPHVAILTVTGPEAWCIQTWKSLVRTPDEEAEADD